MSKILVIDDSELVSKLLRDGLTEAGFEVAAAMDANEGYAAAIEFGPDLILLDVQLPDVAGSDLIGIIKNRDDLKHIPIIMITGTHQHTEHKVKAFQAGADDYVLKPFEMAELVERVKAVLRRCESRTPLPEPSSAHALPRTASLLQPASLPKAWSLAETVRRALLDPDSLAGGALPSISSLYVTTLVLLSLGGWFLSAGSTVKPVVIGLGTAGFWGLCVSFLVMSCSIMGVTVTWKHGARLMCLAALPLLLKLAGGFVTTVATSLTPFYFTASPALFFKKAPVLMERLDVFELWTLWLVASLIKSCKGSSKQKGWIVAAVVWPVLAFWQSLWKH